MAGSANAMLSRTDRLNSILLQRDAHLPLFRRRLDEKFQRGAENQSTFVFLVMFFYFPFLHRDRLAHGAELFCYYPS
jgi:hypothetical protein